MEVAYKLTKDISEKNKYEKEIGKSKEKEIGF